MSSSRPQSVLQPWVETLSMMQQTVVMECSRGPDGVTKYHPSKYLLRWYRRCFLFSAFDKRVLLTPWEEGGGSFTGPSYQVTGPIARTYKDEDQNKTVYVPLTPWEEEMDKLVDQYIRGADELPHHFYRHLMHGVEILGYKHPEQRIRTWWNKVYLRLARDLHLSPETEAQLDERLGDTRSGWLKHGDEATVA